MSTIFSETEHWAIEESAKQKRIIVAPGDPLAPARQATKLRVPQGIEATSLERNDLSITDPLTAQNRDPSREPIQEHIREHNAWLNAQNPLSNPS